MLLDLTQKLFFANEDLSLDAKPLTLRFVLVEALLSQYKDEPMLDDDVASWRFNFAEKLTLSVNYEFNALEKERLNYLLMKRWSLVIAGSARRLLHMKTT